MCVFPKAAPLCTSPAVTPINTIKIKKTGWINLSIYDLVCGSIVWINREIVRLYVDQSVYCQMFPDQSVNYIITKDHSKNVGLQVRFEFVK